MESHRVKSKLTMNHRMLSPVFALLALFVALIPRPAQADLDVSFDYFYEALAPYGHWADIEGYGYCWTPDAVDADWVPYSEGNWVYTDAGWTWEGDEDFSAIVYHYGRWVLVEGEGWFWGPGYEWGPAWVSWRDSEDYIGWAPLPPDAVWQPAVGFGVWVDDVYDIGPRYYSFCHRRDFGEHHLRRYILPRRNNMLIINETLNITNISYRNSHGLVHCGGPDYDRANRFATHAIPSLHLVQRQDFDFRSRDRHREILPRGVATGDSFVVVAPHVMAQPGGRSVHPETSKKISKDLVHKGWVGMGDAQEREAVRKKIHTETKGLNPKNAPARTITADELRSSQRATGNTITSETRRAVVPRQDNPPKAIAVPQVTIEDNTPRGRMKTFDGGRNSDQIERERRNRETMEQQSAAREKFERMNAENAARQREAELLAKKQAMEAQHQRELIERQKNEQLRINTEKMARHREAEESARRNLQREQEMQRQRSNQQPQVQEQGRGRDNRGHRSDDDDKKKKK